MITNFSVDNYKSLCEISLSFGGFNVLVGNNASGKSSVLQAIDFLIRSASEDFVNILEQRGLLVSDVISRLTRERQIRFCSEHTISDGESSYSVCWEMAVETQVKDNKMLLASERIIDLDKETVLLSYSREGGLVIYDGDEEERKYPPLSLASSSLKVAVNIQSEKRLPQLVALKKFLISSCSYEMLSPSEMRQSSRGKVQSIGTSGRDLPSYIKGMTRDQAVSYIGTLREILGNESVESIDAHTQGKPGWTRLEAVEKYGARKLRISSKGMSDGMLRLLAFTAICHMDTAPSLALLDEIENGINANYAEKLIDFMKSAYDKRQRQMIVTTHSTVFLDYVDKKDIIYLYRDENTGFSKAVNLQTIPEINSRLEYMYPGEIFLNMSNREIMDRILEMEATGEEN